MWDLVWAGENTNDTLAPVRAMLSATSSRPGRAARGSRGRPRPGQLRRVGPPSAAGRWSRTSSLFAQPATETERAHLRALQLIERHGVLTREGALGDGVVGGFAAVYPVLRALEERGQVKRGYFVEGLGGAQFAASGAVDRLREFREAAELPQVDVLSAVDPAQPYGATLPWPQSPGRPSRTAGAYLVVVDGQPVVFVERGGRSLATFESAIESIDVWIDPLRALVDTRRLKSLEVAKIDGEPAHGSPLAQALIDAGFSAGYKGPTYRA